VRRATLECGALALRSPNHELPARSFAASVAEPRVHWPHMTTEYPLFATAAKGTEGALRDELREIRFRGIRADRGGVHFTGTLDDAARACLQSRVAMRVLVQVASFAAASDRALYDGIRSVDFTPFLSVSHTLAVSATCRSSVLTHSQFIALQTKDAIVDAQRDATGVRSSVDVNDPDVRVVVHLVKDHATVYLDASGEPLHRRGYRRDVTEAPLKETLAAAILRLAGWDRARPLIDPMCGSGTFAIEADLWARNVAPGIARDFGFERWASHDDSARERFEAMRVAARAAQRTESPPIVASDFDETALAIARGNARTASARNITFERKHVRDIAPTNPPGFVVTNPPYGERLVAADALYADMARAFTRLRGHTIAILAGTPEIARALPSNVRYRAHTLFNGNLECRLITFENR
jgi:putative N6-adenine-specific DNA methylase